MEAFLPVKAGQMSTQETRQLKGGAEKGRKGELGWEGLWTNCTTSPAKPSWGRCWVGLAPPPTPHPPPYPWLCTHGGGGSPAPENRIGTLRAEEPRARTRSLAAGQRLRLVEVGTSPQEGI